MRTPTTVYEMTDASQRKAEMVMVTSNEDRAATKSELLGKKKGGAVWQRARYIQKCSALRRTKRDSLSWTSSATMVMLRA